jgi:hypothetical protein
MFDRISSYTKPLAALSLVFAIQPALAQTANQVKQTPPILLGTSQLPDDSTASTSIS